MLRFNSLNSLDVIEKMPCYIAFDCEWTKNYRVRNANEPFCFSIVSIPITSTINENLIFSIAYAYVDSPEESNALVAEADRLIVGLLEQGHTFVGLQLSSDIAALSNSVLSDTPGLTLLRNAWRERRDTGILPRVVDTRYDLDHLLANKSRRLVDVCQEFGLLVTQPELGNSSMTALQRHFLASRDEAVRERLQILNIRHSLSCGILAALCDVEVLIRLPLNLNRILFQNLKGRFDYLESPMFQGLLEM